MERAKIITIIGFVLLFIVLLFVFSDMASAGDVYVSPDQDAGWYDVTHVLTIQEGVDNVSIGGTVYVWDGTYTEEITIGKSIDLIGNGSVTTMIVSDTVLVDVVTITSSWVNISNFGMDTDAINTNGITISGDNAKIDTCKIVNATDYGIRVAANNVNILNCIMQSNSKAGIFIGAVNNTVVRNCNISLTTGASWGAIYTRGTYTTIDNCDFFNNNIKDIKASSTAANIWINNSDFTEGDYHILCDSVETFNISNCNISNYNTIGVYVVNSEGGNIYNCNFADGGNVSGGGAILASAIRIWTEEGPGSYYNISENTFTGNNIAVSIIAENYVNVFNNNFVNNNYSFHISGSSGIVIYNNDISSVVRHIYDIATSSAVFNISKTLGTNIVNGSYLGGNYWSDYRGSDADGDGIGDVVYNISTSLIFDLLDTQDDGNNYWNVWGDGTYIYTVGGADGIRAYTFDGASFTLKDTQYDGGTYYDIWGDDTYIYVACSIAEGGGSLRAYTFDGTNFVLKGTQNDESFCYGVWGDGSYIYTACGADGIRAYTFNGTSFTLKDTQDDSSDDYWNIWGDGTYIYVACRNEGDGTLCAYTFDGTSFTLKDTQQDGFGEYCGVWGDGTYIYTACVTDGIRAYTFDGTNFVLKDTQNDESFYYGVWGDGSYIYTACGADGIRAYTFDGTNFVLKDTHDAGGIYYGVWGDGSYIYTACGADGIRAYVFPTIASDYLPLANYSATLDADFYYSPKQPGVEEKVSFFDRSLGDNIVQYHWNFGDGFTSVGKTTNHRYDESRRYKVTLTITNSHGNTDSCFKYVTVKKREFSIVFPEPGAEPYTISEMYQLLGVDKIPSSNAEMTIVFIDTGYTPRMYGTTDLSRIQGAGDPIYVSVFDRQGHGTWISYALMYILQEKLPNANLISYRVFDDDGYCTMQQVMDAFDYVEKIRPEIVSFSGGGLGSPDDALSKKVERLRNQGIIVVIAAGNSGPSAGTILSPACSRGAFAIGATDPMKTILNLEDDIVTVWSSRGPVTGVVPKPDYTAPGESIMGPWLYGERVVSGTSMATPLFAGGIAVVYGNNKNILGVVDLLYFWDGGIKKSILENGITDTVYVKGDANSYGFGIPDFDSANSAVLLTCIVYIGIWFAVLAVVIIAVVFVYKKYFSEKKHKTREPFFDKFFP